MTWVQVESSDGEKSSSWIWLPSSNYRDLKYLASGGFGDIYTASVVKLPSKNSVVALKKIPLEPRRLSYRVYGKILAKLRRRKTGLSSMSTYEEAKNEVEMMKAVQGNKYILSYYDSFSIGRHYWIATEFAKFGDLREIVQHSEILKYNDYNEQGHLGLPLQKSLPLDLLIHLMAPIFDAVKYLHSKGVIHRDIKEDNILITEKGVPKLCDFGTACQYNGVAIPYRTGYVGTESYSPPEIVQKKDYDTKVDVWALGVTMLSLHFCGWPYTHEFNNGGLGCVREFLDVNGGYELSLQSEYFGEEGATESLHEFARLRDFESKKQYDPTQWKEFERFLKRIIVYDSAARPSVADLCDDMLLKPVMKNWNEAREDLCQATKSSMTNRFLKIAKDSYGRKGSSTVDL